ncbi:alpha/beta fold hydrolase [Clostridium sp. CF012]|uniref:alpha/beta fold hydrolase n=1 Tax=Clostridium sp. CF012 TaxID=2843319 RepID=UPI001C0DBC19|nr:alpha/beta hydrolase [Clostridium sp. CF012]MBU3144843.1 alpha/beta hydrolase [Clostridium sp. CF012]
MDNCLSEKTINTDGCTIHYWISNNIKGRWLIFLHGAGADHEMFNDQLHVLSETFKVLLWDARGHGLSRPMGDKFSIKLLVEDLIKIMDIENIDKSTFIGQSMGGNIVQEMAFYYPNKVENLVLIDCTCNTMKLSNLEKFYLNITPFLIPLYPWNYLVNESVKASSITLEVQSYLRKAFNKIGKKDFSKIFLETAACLHYEKAYRINKSILLVYGESDKTGNIKKIAQSWASKEPNCELIKIKDASHCSNQDNPLEFNKVLIAFLNKQY